MEQQQFIKLMSVLKDIKNGVINKNVSPEFNASNLTLSQQAKIAIDLFKNPACDLHMVLGVGRVKYINIMEKLEAIAQLTE
jgi:hypothetical protein